MLPKYKVCPNCLVNKKASEYHKRIDKGYEYLKSYCKSCSAARNKTAQYDKCSCGNNKTKRSTSCQSCANINQQKYETLEDILHYRNKYGQSAAFNIVRGRARNAMKHITQCQVCGYSKHVEVCHIKPISEFDNNTLISDINHITNLYILCPNCHWEFDNGILEIGN
jgi:5-methylcytosine-specific restriction endonuclease McrA